MKKVREIKIWMLAAVLAGCAATAAHAQEQLEREMTLEREYDPTVQDANKINRLPEVKEPVVTKRPIDYSPFTAPADPAREITVLPSGNILTEIAHNKRRGYFHFGGGMYANLSGDLGYHIVDNGQGALALYATHRSTNGNVKFPEEYGIDRRKAMLNDNHIRLDLDHAIGQNATLNLGASYGYTGFNYYGRSFLYSSSSLFAPEENSQTNQANQTVAFNAGLSGAGNDRFGYLMAFDFHHFDQKYGWWKTTDGIRENRFSPRFDLHFFTGDADRRIGLAGALDYFDYNYPDMYNRNDSGYQNHLEATVTPYFLIERETWRLRLGANVMFVHGDSLKIFASPNVSVEARVAERTVFHARAQGEISSNDARTLARLNRYTDHSMEVSPSRTWLDAEIGIRSGIAQGLQLDVFAGYRDTKDAIFFIRNACSDETMDFSAYSATLQTDASRMHVGAVVKYAFRDLVDFSLKGVYNQWTVASDGRSFTRADAGSAGMKPYGLPKAELNADLTVKPLPPMAVTLGYYLAADRYTLDPAGAEEKRMKDLHDLNLSASWNFNDTFGAYVKLNNLLFQQQELVYGYPLQGFNAMAGININF
jgi:hypothetical protein